MRVRTRVSAGTIWNSPPTGHCASFTAWCCRRIRRIIRRFADAQTNRPVALNRLTGEAQIEALNEHRDALRVNLEPVPGAEVSQNLRLRLRDTPKLDQFAEEPLE